MIRKFLRDDFTLIFQKNKDSGIVVTFNKSSVIIQFGLVFPGNVYLLLDSSWVLIDISTLSFKTNYLEKSSEALISGLIKMTHINLTSNEKIFLEIVLHDMVLNKQEWLPLSDSYLLKGDKIEINKIEYELRGDRKIINIQQPKIMISPVNLRSSGMGVAIETVMIHKAPDPIILPPITINPEPNYNNIHPSVLEIVMKRAKYKTDEMISIQKNEQLKEDEELKQLKKQRERERMVRLQIIQQNKKVEKQPKMMVVNESDTEEDDENNKNPIIVPDSIFIKAAEHVGKIKSPKKNDDKGKEELTNDDEEDWFVTITRSANPDITITKSQDETVRDEVIDSMFSTLSQEEVIM